MIQSTQAEKNFFETKILLEEYQFLLDKTTSISKSDLHGRITYVNDNFCKLSGYTREEIMGKPHSIFRAPDVDPAVYKELWATIQSKKIWRGEVKNRAKDGSYYYFEATIMPLLDSNQEIVEYISVRIDNTENKQLKENNRYTNSILEASSEAQIIIDEFSNITDFNQKAQLVFKHIHTAIPPLKSLGYFTKSLRSSPNFNANAVAFSLSSLSFIFTCKGIMMFSKDVFQGSKRGS